MAQVTRSSGWVRRQDDANWVDEKCRECDGTGRVDNHHYSGPCLVCAEPSGRHEKDLPLNRNEHA